MNTKDDVREAIRSKFRALLVCAFGLMCAVSASETVASDGTTSAPDDSSLKPTTNIVELSLYQQTHCKRKSAGSVDGKECAKARSIVDMMNHERRDTAWAGGVEESLRDWIDSLASVGISQREVQCRLSWCLIELGATEAQWEEQDPKLADIDLRKKLKLFQYLFLYAPDVDDASMADITIIYKRYCESVAEVLDSEGHVFPDFYTAGQHCENRRDRSR